MVGAPVLRNVSVSRDQEGIKHTDALACCAARRKIRTALHAYFIASVAAGSEKKRGYMIEESN